MKKKTLLLLSVFLLAVLVIVFYFIRKDDKKQDVAFLTAMPRYGDIAKMITATGTVEPVDTVTVGAQVSGVVKSVYADFNSKVKQGQLLAEVDPTIIQAQTEQAKANLATMQSNLQYQQSNFDRQNKLYQLGAISMADYQVALNQFQSAKAAVNNAKAQVKMAQRNLYYTQIYSPINGVVLNRNISAGQTIASSFNAPTLFVLARDLTKMQVDADVDEADVGGVNSGQRVTFSVDAFPEETFEGNVQQILLHPAVSANVVTYTTRITIDNQEMKLKPGMTARINIYTQEDSNALLIPSKALNFVPDSTLPRRFVIISAEHGGSYRKGAPPNQHPVKDDSTSMRRQGRDPTTFSYVWVKQGDTLVEKRVITGINDDSNVEVIKGLTPDDEVITRMLTGKENEKDKSNGTSSSPFMPRMRRSQPSKAGGAPPR